MGISGKGRLDAPSELPDVGDAWDKFCGERCPQSLQVYLSGAYWPIGVTH